MKSFELGLFDKLFHDDGRDAPHALRRLSVDTLKDAVARDLEALLNARRALPDDALAVFPQCQHSVLTFGIADIAGLSLASDADRQRICDSLKQAIARHEPRLSDVAVVLQVDPHATAMLCFAISAALDTGSVREPVSFDASLQTASLQYAVRKGRGAGATF